MLAANAGVRVQFNTSRNASMAVIILRDFIAISPSVISLSKGIGFPLLQLKDITEGQKIVRGLMNDKFYLINANTQ